MKVEQYSKRGVIFWVVIFLLIAPIAHANQLEKLGFSSLPGNRIQVSLNFLGQAQEPVSFSTANPARIVLDFPGTTLNLKEKSQLVGVGVVQSISAVETRDRTRVVVNLVRMMPFDIEVSHDRVIVLVKNMPSASPTSTTYIPLSSETASSPSEFPSELVSSEIVSVAGPHIQDIDFRRTSEGTARIVATLSDPTIVVNIQQKGQTITVDFFDTQLPEKLNQRLDVIDFATPVTFIDTFPDRDNVRMNITVEGDYEYHSQQSENNYIIEINKKVEIKSEDVEIEERKYEGQLVSFNFQDIEVRAALALLFDLPGVNLNMVASDEVKGNVTLRLKNIPWDQALDIILEAQGLGRRQIGNVVMIDLKENIDARKQKELEAKKAIKELEPLYTEFIRINYAKAEELENLIRTKDEHSFLSARGSVSTHAESNTLIIQDTAAKLAEIRSLIASLDIPIRQVLIESRIVLATNDFSRDLGVKFGYSANEDLGHGNGIVFGGKMPGDTQYSGNTAFNTGNSEDFIVTLPVDASAAIGLAIGKIGSYLLQLELMAAERKGLTRIISSPRIITGNQKEASISQGQKIPYRSLSEEGQKVQFEDATLELLVTPQITPDDRIILELEVKADKPTGDTNDGQIIISKRQLTTKVLVDNGETIVLGGVYEQTNRSSLRRVPFFADLPLVGNLFKAKEVENLNDELLIFVTPKIIKEAA